MNRLTRTKLEKLLYIHDCRVDQIVEGACSELDSIVKPQRPEAYGRWPSHTDQKRAINMARSRLIEDGLFAPQFDPRRGQTFN